MIELGALCFVAMLGKDYQRQDCSLARALEAIGERWTLLIVRDAFYGVRRFNEFQAHLDVPKAVLSDRLSGLVDDGTREQGEAVAGGEGHPVEPAGPAGVESPLETDLVPAGPVRGSGGCGAHGRNVGADVVSAPHIVW